MHRRGFTVVEVMVAIVLLCVGLLGLAATGALVTRLVMEGRRATVAATLAQRHLEGLLAGDCGAPSSGTSVEAPFGVRWNARPDAGGLAVDVVVDAPVWGARRAFAFHAGRPCGR